MIRIIGKLAPLILFLPLVDASPGWISVACVFCGAFGYGMALTYYFGSLAPRKPHIHPAVFGFLIGMSMAMQFGLALGFAELRGDLLYPFLVIGCIIYALIEVSSIDTKYHPQYLRVTALAATIILTPFCKLAFTFLYAHYLEAFHILK